MNLSWPFLNTNEPATSASTAARALLRKVPGSGIALYMIQHLMLDMKIYIGFSSNIFRSVPGIISME